MLFPVYLYEEGMELPKEGTYYVIAGNGSFMHKDIGVVHGFIPVKDVPVLSDFNVGAKIGVRLPKIEAIDVHRIKEFFRRVVDKHHAEANTVLYYNVENRKYKIVVPDQNVSHGGVNYTREGISHKEEFDGYRRVGTIHSHCDFGAFHSSTDIGDERDFDGIHLTFGHNDKDIFTISCSMVMNGFRVKVDPMRFLKGVEPLTGFDPNQDEDKSYWRVQGEQKFRLVEIPKETRKKWFEDIDKEWMPKVGKGLFGGYGAAGRWGASQDKTIREGDSVRLKNDPAYSIFKRLIGYGTYNVTRVSKSAGTIVIHTKVGRARFKIELFEKVPSYSYFQPKEPQNTQTQKVVRYEGGKRVETPPVHRDEQPPDHNLDGYYGPYRDFFEDKT